MIFFPPFQSYLLSAHSPFTPVRSEPPLPRWRRSERTVVNKQNRTTSRQSGGFFWGVTSTEFFWAGDSTKLKAKSGRSPLSQTGASGPVGPGGGREGWGGGRWVGGRWRGGRVRGRRGKGTFAVQLAALCEAGTVGPYREESESGAFSSLVPPPPLVSFPPHSVPSLSHFNINSSLPSFCGWSLEQQGHTFHTQHSLLIFIIPDEDRPSFVEHTHASRAQTHSSLDSSGARIVRLLRRIRGRSSRGNKGITCVLY